MFPILAHSILNNLHAIDERELEGVTIRGLRDKPLHFS